MRISNKSIKLVRKTQNLMKTNQTYNTIVRETTRNYLPENQKKKVLAWILTTDGQMLIKTPQKRNRHIRITNLTIHNGTLNGTIHKVEKESGILCNSDLFKKVFTSKSTVNTNLEYEMYLLCVNLDKEHKEFIEDQSRGKFVDYREIMNYLSSYELTSNCKDKLLSLISSLYDRYSFI